MTCTPCNMGEQVAWTEFVPYIALYVKGAPDATMIHAARLSAIELARTTKNLTREVVFDVQGNVPDYTIELPDDYTVGAIKLVCCGGRPVSVMPERGCCERGYKFLPPSDIVISPVPQCDMPRFLYVTVHAVPGQDSCEIDRWYYEQFAELVADGAIYRLLLMKGASWYDAGLANTYRAKFYAGMKSLKTLRAKRNTTAATFAPNRTRMWL